MAGTAGPSVAAVADREGRRFDGRFDGAVWPEKKPSCGLEAVARLSAVRVCGAGGA